MKFLFTVQGEGRGHLTQAIATREMLERAGHQVVGVLVGRGRGMTLPPFLVERLGDGVATFDSPCFLFPRDGGRARVVATFFYHACRPARYARGVSFIRRTLAASGAEAVINFYEPVAGLAFALRRPRVPVYCVGHQYLFLHPGFVFPRGRRRLDTLSLLWFTRLTAARATR
ncbi:MAG: glycosyltransferase, partial [Odoribacteraceae bacterium]|nr:glycosyltransferase [Odoribacteraceae bacterium]